MKVCRWTLAAGLLLWAGFAAAETDLASLVADCEACHGPGGASTEDDVPGLAGMDKADLIEAIEAFYFYERHCSNTTYRSDDHPKTPMNMCNVANTLSAEDREAIAGYFSSQ